MPSHTFDRLQDNPNNPRTITQKKAAALKRALARFGDLGGFVLNRRDGTLISGHQRRAALEDVAGAVHIEREYPEASATGTVAEGYVDVNGERFAYREVDWDPQTAKAASLAANNPAGSWSMPALEGWLAELNEEGFAMDLTMFDEAELRMYLPKPDASPPAPAAQGHDFDPQTGEVVEFVAQDKPRRERPGKDMRTLQLFYDNHTHAKVMELIEGLQAIYGAENASHTVYEALQRGAVSAATKVSDG